MRRKSGSFARAGFRNVLGFRVLHVLLGGGKGRLSGAGVLFAQRAARFKVQSSKFKVQQGTGQGARKIIKITENVT
jgi:hypothetical protein